MTPSSDRKKLLARILDSETRLSAKECIRLIARDQAVSVKTARHLLRQLVENGELSYQDLYGNTYVTENFKRPVHVSPHLYLCPPGTKSIAGPGQKDIFLNPGIAFGSGHHPTTRLSLNAIDHLYFNSGLIQRDKDHTTADIGTGSGVLAIAACTCGPGICHAFDIDANAVSEAKKNIEVNDLAGRIRVIDRPFATGPPTFSLITANLRFPTLKALSALIRNRIMPGGYLILSGIREWETEGLVSHYTAIGFSLVRQERQKKWAALILKHNRPEETVRR